MFVFSMCLIPFVGAEFLPESDEGSVNISVKLPYGTNLDRNDSFIRISGKLEQIPEIEGIMKA